MDRRDSSSSDGYVVVDAEYNGPAEPNKPASEVYGSPLDARNLNLQLRQEPFPLPDSDQFEWSDVDVKVRTDKNTVA